MPKTAEYLRLVLEHKYPLVKDYPSLTVNDWESNLLLSRRTSSAQVQELLDQHLIATIWATRQRVLDPQDFVKREVDYRTFCHYPPTTKFFALSIADVYDQLIADATAKGMQDHAQFLGALKGQFEGILRAAGFSYGRELGDAFRDVLSTYQRYPGA